MDRFRVEATFHATDSSRGVEFRENRFEASSRDAAVRDAGRFAAARPGIRLVRAALFDGSDGAIWSLPSEQEGQP